MLLPPSKQYFQQYVTGRREAGIEALHVLSELLLSLQGDQSLESPTAPSAGRCGPPLSVSPVVMIPTHLPVPVAVGVHVGRHDGPLLVASSLCWPLCVK